MTSPDSRLLEVAEEQLRWIRAAAIPEVRRTIAAALDSVERRRAYELHDGSRTGVEVSVAAKVPQQTLSRWTREWRNLGIANEVTTSKGIRIRHLMSLSALGIPIEGAAGENN
jgi:hypothetical protein